MKISDDLIRIGKLADKYNISNRTLRYYEKEGLLKSIRKGSAGYRYYDREAVKELENILLLRKIDLTIDEIKSILASDSITEIIEILMSKVKKMNQELQDLKSKKEIIEEFVFLLSNNNYKDLGEGMTYLQEKYISLKTQLEQKENKQEKGETTMTKLKDSEVRIIELKPTWVVSYRAEGESPESKAWEVIKNWTKESNILERFESRIFGFDNPPPSKGNSIYGYEFWITIPEKMKVPDPIEIKKFSGGLYAVTNTNMTEFDVGERWQQLYNWVKDSKYQIAEGNCLEEHISPLDRDTDQNTIQLDLYEPIKL